MSDKTIGRVEKLLRLAAPNSGATDAERVSAALEAAKVFSENGLTVARKEAPAPKMRVRQPPSYTAPQSYPPQYTAPRRPHTDWTRSVAARNTFCADVNCCGPISRGDPVWIRHVGMDVEYLHIDAPCGDLTT